MGRIKGDGMVNFVNFDSSKILKYSGVQEKGEPPPFFLYSTQIAANKRRTHQNKQPIRSVERCGCFCAFHFPSLYELVSPC